MDNDAEDAAREQKLLFDLESEFPVDNGGNGERATPLDPCGYYAALSLTRGATPAEVRHAFHVLSQAYHTDKHSQQDTETQLLMNRRFQEIQQAYAVLSDPLQRAAYDHSGQQGLKRLELIPAPQTHTKDEVLKILDALSREAEIRTTARLLRSTGQITAIYSIAHLFEQSSPKRAAKNSRRLELNADPSPTPAPQRPDSSPEALEQPQQLPVSEGQRHLDPLPPQLPRGADTAALPLSSATAAAAADTSNAQSGTASVSGTPAAAAVQPATSTPPAAHSAPARSPVGAQVAVRKIILDGKEVVVAIFPEHLQQQMLALATRSGTGGIALPPSDGSGDGTRVAATEGPAAPQISSRLVRVGMLASCVIPRSIAASHSFSWPITPSLNVTFRADGSHNPQGTSVGFSTHAEYAADGISSFASTWRAAVGTVKWTLAYTRALSQTWTLKQKLTVVDGLRYLDSYRLTLTRKLSESTELANTVSWGLDGGFFQSTIASGSALSHLGAQLRIAYQGLSFTMYRVMPTSFGIATATAPSRAAGQSSGGIGCPSVPRRGKVQQTVSFNPFTGQTNVGYELWWFVSRLQHLGVGVSATLPVSLSPIHPPLFLCASTSFFSLCQFHLLYARGEHKISIPVLVCVSHTLHKGLLWLTLPWLVYRLGWLVARPIAMVRAARGVVARRKRCKDEVEAARANALREQAALHRSAQRSRSAEEHVGSEGGLILINAQYGLLKRGHATLEEVYPLELDVTVPLQHLVRHSRLLLPEGAKHTLVGFYDIDPATNEKRQLKIAYWFRGVRHLVMQDEEDAVELPQADHVVRA